MLRVYNVSSRYVRNTGQHSIIARYVLGNKCSGGFLSVFIPGFGTGSGSRELRAMMLRKTPCQGSWEISWRRGMVLVFCRREERVGGRGQAEQVGYVVSSAV